MTASPCRSPGAEPGPDRFDAPIDLWNPGGDPAVLRRAAGAWREMAARLRQSAGAVDREVAAVGGAWSGPAADAFGRHWRRVRTGMTAGGETCEQVARTLDAVAREIEDTNDQVHDLYVAVGITVAVGAIGSAVTFGFASAGAAAMATRHATQAAVVVARLQAFLQASGRTLSGLRAALGLFARRWAVAAAGNTVATAVQKAIANPTHNPLDGWGISDVTQIVVASTSSMGATTLATGWGRFRAVATARPVLASVGTGVAGNAAGSVAGDLWARDQPFSWTTVRRAALNGGAGGVGAGGTTALLRRFGGPPRAAAPTLLQRLPPGTAQEAAVSVPLEGVVQGLVPADEGGADPPRSRGDLDHLHQRRWLPPADQQPPTGRLRIGSVGPDEGAFVRIPGQDQARAGQLPDPLEERLEQRP